MNKLGIAALIAGIATASCSGHGVTPSVSSGPSSVSQNAGSGTTRAASIATAPAGWSTTGTQATTFANASKIGALAGSTPLTVRVGLQLRNVAQLQSAVANGQILSPAEFAATYGPTSDQVAAVTSYLQSKGFTNVTAEPNNLLVSADGTAADAEAAFNTSLSSFSLGGATVYANTAPAYVPTSLGGTVVAVLGLNNAAKMAATPKMTGCYVGGTGSAPCVRLDYDPQTYWKTYDAGSTPTGSRTTVAVMAEGDVSQTVADLRTAESAWKLPQVPVSVVQVGLPSPDTAGVDEWNLDTQSSTGIAGNVKHLYIYATTSMTDSDIALEYNKWVTQDVARLGNSSFGICEAFPYVDGSMLVDDEILLQGASQGQTMFASTGDTGSSCAVLPTNGAPASGPPLVEYPAASPYVVAVGGTTLLSNSDGSYLGEAAWNAGGGGVSQFEYSPYWESMAQPQSAPVPGVGGAPVTVRGLPDIAMDADANTGADVYVDGSATVIGGTSLASPLSMGVYARLQSAHGNQLGFGPIAFYKIYSENPNATQTPAGPPPTELVGGFHDVLTGGNGIYTALPRYDYTTGLGSFDIQAVNAAIGR